MASRLATTMCNSLKGRPILGRIFQGKEPPQFVAIFQPMVVLKGGLSSGYKNYISDKGLNDETYTADSVALIRISGTSEHNNKAVQVDAVATSLNSNECFLAQSGSSMFTWHGNQSTYEQQQLASKIAEFLKPGVAAKHTKEGTESSAFWFAIGGKQSYTSKKVAPEAVRDPHLFTYSINKGTFQVEEVYNFSQDDLLTEDVLVLDTHAEVFVWVGQSTDPNEKQNAFEIGQKYIQMATCLEGLSSNAPLYKVTEGNEPCFFTTYFSWDPAKAIANGNSFQKKVMLLFGAGHGAENHPRSNGTNRGGPTQRASALAALNSAFSSSSAPKPVASRPGRSPRSGSQRAAAVAALSSVLIAEKQSNDTSPTRSPTPRSPARSSRSPLTQREASPTAVIENEKTSSEFEDPKGSPVVKETEVVEPVAVANGEGCELKTQQEQDDNNSEGSQTIFSYERLKVKSGNPVTGIDFKRREAYLSNGEFEAVLGMKKEAFYKLPKWKQDMQKKKADLF
nr:villin-3-like [Ipomoea batatas]